MKKPSKRFCIAISYLVIGIASPYFFQENVVPYLTERYEDGYTIGGDLTVFTEKAIANLDDLEVGGSIVIKNGELYLEQEYVFPLHDLPNGVEFYLAPTEKHLSGIEFRKSIDFWLGWIGSFPETFNSFGIVISLIGWIISGVQGTLLPLRRKNIQEKGLYFYEIKYLVVIYYKKHIHVEKNV